MSAVKKTVESYDELMTLKDDIEVLTELLAEAKVDTAYKNVSEIFMPNGFQSFHKMFEEVLG